MKTGAGAWIAFALIAVVLVSGCPAGDFQLPKFGEFFGFGAEEDLAGRAFVGGTEGVTLRFLEDRPPEEVFITATPLFPIVAVLENMGEYTIEPGELNLTLGGVREFENELLVTGVSNQEILEGARIISDTLIPGVSEVVDFGFGEYVGGLLVTGAEKPITLFVCYPYETYAIAPACVITKLPGEVGTEEVLCESSEVKETTNSGAPVHVTFEQFSAAGYPANGGREAAIAFRINVENVGEGTVYLRDRRCGDRKNELEILDMQFVDQTYDWQQIKEFCRGTNVVKLRDGEGHLDCVLDGIESAIDFEDFISVRLRYDYHDTTSTTVIFTRLDVKDIEPPSIVSNFKAAIGTNDTITLTWDLNPAEERIVRYRIYRVETGEGATEDLFRELTSVTNWVGAAGGSPYFNTGLKNATRYCYSILAQDAFNNINDTYRPGLISCLPTTP